MNPPRASARPNPIIEAVSNATAKLRADDDMLALLEAHASLNPLAIEKLDFDAARRNPTFADAVRALLAAQGRSADPEKLVPGVIARDINIDGAEGTLPARVYKPTGAGPFALVVYFHGGGWVLADKDVYDGSARGICKESGALVLSVDYRRAPEYKFPAAWDDALAAYEWALDNAESLGGDPELIAVAGESAGGTLALATAIAARDSQLVQPVHVLAIYPVTQTSLHTEAYLENAIAKPLNRAMMHWFFQQVVEDTEDLEDQRLQLIDAELEGLPPVTLISARIDPLRGDSTKLASALEAAGVEVMRRDYEGATHEFFGCAAVLQKAREAQRFAGERLREAFGTGSGVTPAVVEDEEVQRARISPDRIVEAAPAATLVGINNEEIKDLANDAEGG
jgi:acetyl esterase/lipase